VATFPVSRVGAILAVADVGRSVAFYRERLGFEVDALYDDPPYATLVRDGVRLSLAEQRHPAPDRPGVTMAVPDDPSRTSVVLVLEVADARAVEAALVAEGARLLAEPYAPPWGGLRFFVVDPDGYLVEIEQPG
jgi:catechol 2,3-dioxygenase-like lactoylglutathione lyase family enzyme